MTLNFESSEFLGWLSGNKSNYKRSSGGYFRYITKFVTSNVFIYIKELLYWGHKSKTHASKCHHISLWVLDFPSSAFAVTPLQSPGNWNNKVLRNGSKSPHTRFPSRLLSNMQSSAHSVRTNICSSIQMINFASNQMFSLMGKPDGSGECCCRHSTGCIERHQNQHPPVTSV